MALIDHLIDWNDQGAADNGFECLAPYLPPTQSGRVAARLLREGCTPEKPGHSKKAMEAFGRLAPRLTAADADRLACAVLAELAADPDGDETARVNALRRLAPRTSPAGATQIVDGMLTRIIATDKPSRDSHGYAALDAFANCASRVDATRRRRIVEAFLKWWADTDTLVLLGNSAELATLLPLVVGSLTPEEAAGLLTGSFKEFYVGLFHRTATGRYEAIPILASLVGRVNPDQGQAFWDELFRWSVLDRVAEGRSDEVLQSPESCALVIASMPADAARTLADRIRDRRGESIARRA